MFTVILARKASSATRAVENFSRDTISPAHVNTRKDLYVSQAEISVSETGLRESVDL